jgi:hypothetical protein
MLVVETIAHMRVWMRRADFTQLLIRATKWLFMSKA